MRPFQVKPVGSAWTTSIAADWGPRKSPPSASAASSAASKRRARVPAAASYARAMASQTVSRPIMFAWTA